MTAHPYITTRFWARATVVACIVGLAFTTATASAQVGTGGPQVRFVRCATHPCAATAPHRSILLGGNGFQPGVLVVFTIRRGQYVINATRAARVISPRRLTARVPSDAVSGPVYLLSATGQSNALWLNVRAPGTCPSIAGSGDAVSRWTPVAICVLGLLHQPTDATTVGDVLTIIRYESGGDPSAVNNWDSNAQAGDPSRGLMQVIGETFTTYHDPLLLDNIFDPAANIYAGLAYGIARYGSITNIPGVKSVSAGGPYRPYKVAAR